MVRQTINWGYLKFKDKKWFSVFVCVTFACCFTNDVGFFLTVGQNAFIYEDLDTLKVLLDIPMPDPAKEEAKRKKKEEVGVF